MAADHTFFDFNSLTRAIQQVNDRLQAQAGKAVNVSLTLRNWIIGAYIAEYELEGADRADYGGNLLDELSKSLKKQKVSNTGRRQLYNYLTFYRAYPQILRTVSAQFNPLLPITLNEQKVRTVSAQFGLAPERLLNSLSYSHFDLLVTLDDPLQRAFYEIEWGVTRRPRLRRG